MVSLDDLLHGAQKNDGSLIGQEFCRAAMKWDLESVQKLEPRFLSLDDENKKQFFGYMFQVSVLGKVTPFRSQTNHSLINYIRNSDRKSLIV